MGVEEQKFEAADSYYKKSPEKSPIVVSVINKATDDWTSDPILLSKGRCYELFEKWYHEQLKMMRTREEDAMVGDLSDLTDRAIVLSAKRADNFFEKTHVEEAQLLNSIET